MQFHSTKTTTSQVSTAEAELLALREAGQTAVWLVNLFKELGLKFPPIPIYEDNQAVRRILLNSQYRERFRHRMNVIHCVRDYIQDNYIRIVCCPTQTMIADIGTKVHKAHVWARLMEMIFPKEYHEIIL